MTTPKASGLNRPMAPWRALLERQILAASGVILVVTVTIFVLIPIIVAVLRVG